MFGIDPLILSLTGSVGVYAFSYGTYRGITLFTARASRIIIAFAGGVAISLSVYLLTMDWLGAAIGAIGLLIASALRHERRQLDDSADYSVEQRILDESVSPQLSAELESLGNAIQAGNGTLTVPEDRSGQTNDLVTSREKHDAPGHYRRPRHSQHLGRQISREISQSPEESEALERALAQVRQRRLRHHIGE